MDIKLNRNMIFVGFVLIAFILMAGMAVEAKEQNNKFYTDYNSFSQAVDFMRQGDFVQAQMIFGSLLSEYDDNFQICYYYGYCLSEQQKYKEAAIYLFKAQKMRPALLGEQGYTYSYGKVLYELGDDRAERYLLSSIKYGNNTKMSRTAEDMITNIHAKKSDRG